jgi:hypothetical protein
VNYRLIYDLVMCAIPSDDPKVLSTHGEMAAERQQGEQQGSAACRWRISDNAQPSSGSKTLGLSVTAECFGVVTDVAGLEEGVNRLKIVHYHSTGCGSPRKPDASPKG